MWNIKVHTSTIVERLSGERVKLCACVRKVPVGAGWEALGLDCPTQHSPTCQLEPPLVARPCRPCQSNTRVICPVMACIDTQCLKFPQFWVGRRTRNRGNAQDSAAAACPRVPPLAPPAGMPGGHPFLWSYLARNQSCAHRQTERTRVPGVRYLVREDVRKSSGVMSSEFERLRESCLKKGELFEDPDFPAVQTSIFYHQKPPFSFVWKRPKVDF